MSLTGKQEAFARAYVETGNASKAYRKAYTVKKGTKPETVWTNASQLLADTKVSQRVAELQQKAAKLMLVTVESLTDELEQARAGAAKDGQHAAAVSATMGKAKLHGLLIDKKQLTGPRGGPLQIVDLSRLKGMTEQELEVLERALVQIGIAEGDQDGAGEPQD